jgi:hypothetical protein
MDTLHQQQARFPHPCYPWVIGAAALLAVTFTAMIGVSASGWVDRPFPGFFVLVNRVIPSVGLPHWTGSQHGTLYQRTVASVDGYPISEAADVYRQVGQQPVGSPVTYELRHGSATETVAIPSSIFTRLDYCTVFGTYLWTGLLYLIVGLLGMWFFPGTHLAHALLVVGSAGGIYGLSGVGIYGPTFHIRVHALAEAFLPAAFAYLALVFPRERQALTAPLLAAALTLSLALTIPYQLLLSQPGAYSTMHAASETYLGIVGLTLTARLIVECATSGATNPLLRSATMGAVLGLAVPAIVMLISGLSGGSLPVNVLTSTAFLFPLGFGYGIVRDRLSVRVRRDATVADPRTYQGA